MGSFKQHVQNNGTLYAHIYFAKKNTPLNPISKDFSLDNRIYTRKRKSHRLQPVPRGCVLLKNAYQPPPFSFLYIIALTRYFKKKREFKVKKLVGGKQEVEPEPEKPVEEVRIGIYIRNLEFTWYCLHP